MNITPAQTVAQRTAQPDPVSFAVETAIAFLNAGQESFTVIDGANYPTVLVGGITNEVRLPSDKVESVLEALKEAGYRVAEPRGGIMLQAGGPTTAKSYKVSFC